MEGLIGYPTVDEIESIENYVFGASPPTLAQLRQRAGLAASEKFSVVVFAYEYRPARDEDMARVLPLMIRVLPDIARP